MHYSKPLERLAFIAATTVTVIAAAACDDDTTGGAKTDAAPADASKTDVSDDAGTHSEAGAPTTTSSQSSTTATPAVTSAPGSTANATTVASSVADGGLPDAGSPDGGSFEPSSSGATSQDSQALSDGTSDTSATAGASDTSASDTASITSDDTSSSSEVERPTEDACFEGGGTDAGTERDAGGGLLCSTNTDNGDHCHTLVIPQVNIDEGIDALYVLEDGGTGHTHTVAITAYDVFYLQTGAPHEFESSTDDGHSHSCLVTCAPL